MAQQITIRKICTQCNGTGSFAPASGPHAGSAITCNWPGCDGTGYVDLGIFDIDPGLDDVLDKVNDVLDKCADILEKLDELDEP